MKIKMKGEGLMFIESEKAKISWYNGCGGPQICDYDAEIAVNDNEEIIYISASDCSEGLMFTARRESIFDKLGTDEIFKGEALENIEEFDSYEETQNSKYAKFYKIAKRMIEDIENSHQE